MREIEASLKYIKGSCYKLNDVANLIRNLGVIEADMQLAFCERRIAVVVRKLLQSAIANAENNFKISKERLQVSRIDVGKSFVLKRSMPRGRGRMTRIEKRYSNLRIVLCEKKAELKKKTNKVVKKEVSK
jgi:large subunit ribosomal protein L22